MSDYSRLHSWKHETDDLAKAHIHHMLGDISEIKIYGRQVLVAVYVRPIYNSRTKLFTSLKDQKEDFYQGKTVLILKCGPTAFDGDHSYLKATFPDGKPPKVGDWVFANQTVGLSTSISGDGAARVKFKDHRDEDCDVYEWDGWPCRFLMDDQIIGACDKPHAVI
jgi:hypothetical protein